MKNLLIIIMLIISNTLFGQNIYQEWNKNQPFKDSVRINQYTNNGISNSQTFNLTPPNTNNQLNNGNYDGFYLKLNPCFELQYFAFLGGDDDDIANGIAISNHDIFISGQSNSTNFIQPINQASWLYNSPFHLKNLNFPYQQYIKSDCFQLGFSNNSNMTYQWFTYYGGSGFDKFNASDFYNDKLYSVGKTTSSYDFPHIGINTNSQFVSGAILTRFNFPFNLNVQNTNKVLDRMVLYPNPTNNALNFNTIYKELFIFDMLGQQVFHTKKIATSSIDVSFLKNGIYLFKGILIDDNNESTLFIKN